MANPSEVKMKPNRSLLIIEPLQPDWTNLTAVKVGGSKPEFLSQTVDLDYKITREFLVHEELFGAQSPFFEAAFGRDFIEAHERVVKLPEHTPQAFEVYLRWVYSSRIMIPGMAAKMTRKTEMAVHNVMCRAYILGDILHDGDFQDALFDAIVASSGTGYMTEEAKFIYQNTTRGSPLRRVLVAMTASDVLAMGDYNDGEDYGESVYGEYGQKYSTMGFLCDVMRLLDRRLDPGEHYEADIMAWSNLEKAGIYHKHREGQCYRSRIDAKTPWNYPRLKTRLVRTAPRRQMFEFIPRMM